MKTISKGKMWCFAIGQFGWSLLSALITNWLVYFYQPDADMIAAGQTLFIPQGRVILGIATVIGGIAALGRVFDAVTDPMIANLSDRSTNPRGRRIPKPARRQRNRSSLSGKSKSLTAVRSSHFYWRLHFTVLQWSYAINTRRVNIRSY